MTKRRGFLAGLVGSGLLVSAAWGKARPEGGVDGTIRAGGAPSLSEDMATVRGRLRESLLLGVDERVQKNADAHIESMRADGSWADQEYADKNRENWKAGAHLGRLLTIARSYYLPGSEMGKRPEVKERLVTGLAYWLRVDPTNDNWWHNQIGVPKQVGELLILMGSDSPAELVQQGTTLMVRGQMDKMTGQNLVWTAEITILRGTLSQAPDIVDGAYKRMWEEVRYAGPNQEGVQVDASFHQHGALLYAGGYGAGFTSDVTRFVDYARGTRFALPQEKQAILDTYVLDGQQWMVRGGQWDHGVTGREFIRPGKSAAGLVRPVVTLSQVPGPRQKEMQDFAARLQNKPDAPPLVGNRHYWLSDYMAHHRAGYFASTHMYSTRTINTDGLTNGENKTSHHMADGAMYLVRSGQEYVGIYPVWDWHRIPGTTVEQNTILIPNKVNHRGTTRFVGGVSDGRYGAATMDLQTGDMKAQKAWFYFDDEVVCLGTGITCPTANPVYTSLNQTLLSGPVRSSQDNGAEVPKGDRSLTGATWVWHDGMGYVFSSPTNAHLRNNTQTGSLRDLGPGSPDPISKDVFILWLDHGPQAQNASYAYVVLPASDAAQTASAASQLPVEITSNTPALQSVYHRKLGILAAAFRAPGSAKAGKLVVSADTPCLVLAQRVGEKLRLSVSNPLNEPATVNLTVNARLTGEGASSAGAGMTRVQVLLPGGLQAGKTVVRELGVGK